MINQVIGIDINVPGIDSAIVDIETGSMVDGTEVFEPVDTHETAENLINSWADVITRVHALRDKLVSHIGIAIPGPFDYENGISLMTQSNKFGSLYQLNVKQLLAEKLGISSDNIRMTNDSSSFVGGEALSGAARGYNNVLAFTLNYGFGSARYINGVSEDASLWNKPFKDGIAEDCLGIAWLIKRYHEFTGIKVSGIKELAELAKTDDGIGQLIFNEYGENFVKFLLQYINLYQPDLLLFGGRYNVWDLFLDHVIDRLGDKSIKIPVKKATLGNQASIIGAADLWRY